MSAPRADVLDSFAATALAAARGVAQEEFLRTAVESVAAMLGAEHCSLLLLDGNRLRRGAEVGLPEPYVAAIDGMEIGPGQGTCGTAAYLRRPVVTEDIAQDRGWDGFRELARAAGLRSCWSVPVRLPGGAVLGTFATYDPLPVRPGPDHVRLAESYAAIVALGLDFLRGQADVSRSYESVVLALSGALDARDEYTAEHSAQTGELARAVGARLGLAPLELERLKLVAQLHDIGKLGVPTEILVQSGPLDPEKRALMREHPVIGERILRTVPDFADVADAVRHEHERWDGSGYPDGLAGAQIPLLSRIVFACDAYHAMTSDRPYRPARPAEEARRELREHAGLQFDPHVAQALLEVLGEEGPPAGAGLAEQDSERTRALRALAQELDADDLLVFRRVAPDVFSHLGGAGRGEGWAGNIDLVPSAEPHLVAALDRGEPVIVDPGRTGRIAGPYQARSAVIVPCGPDLVVVFGSTASTLGGVSLEHAQTVAERAVGVIDHVSPAKRLADELEVLDAVRAVTMLPSDAVGPTLAACAGRAADALSCEWAAVALLDANGSPRVVRTVERGWAPTPPEATRELLAALLSDPDGLPLLVQDTGETSRLPEGFRSEDGAGALLVVPIGSPPVALLAAVHAEPRLRGFTALCRRVASAVADAAEVVVGRSVAAEQLAEENATLVRALREDAVTGAASRSAWEEALWAEERRYSGAGAESSVAVIDLDSLKEVNDRDGHAAGDALLRECALVLRGASRPMDLVARLGGDEFGVLLRPASATEAETWRRRAEARLAAAGISASVGIASAPPCASAAAAVDLADRRMYVAKASLRPGPVAPV